MNRTPRIIPLTLTATLLGASLTGCGALSDTASDASSTTSQSTAATVAEATAGAAAAADVLAANAEVHTGDLEYDEADVRTVTLSGDSASSGAAG